jgi:glycosyltransferase involved in cell wall biosynthesis
VLEALAAGLPVLVSEAVPLAREVKAHQLGEAVPLEIEAIRFALGRLLRAPPFHPERLRAFVAKNYSWETNAEALAGSMPPSWPVPRKQAWPRPGKPC